MYTHDYIRARVQVGLHRYTLTIYTCTWVYVQLTAVLDGKITFVGKTEQTSRRRPVYIYINTAQHRALDQYEAQKFTERPPTSAL